MRSHTSTRLWIERTLCNPIGDQRYRQRDTPWDKGRASPALIAWLQENHGRMTGSVLIPGCGTGHDVRAIATAEPTSFPVGIDISRTAIEACRQNKVRGNERYEEENLFSLPKTLFGTCDWLWEHTCFCAIAPKERLAMARTSCPVPHPGMRTDPVMRP